MKLNFLIRHQHKTHFLALALLFLFGFFSSVSSWSADANQKNPFSGFSGDAQPVHIVDQTGSNFNPFYPPLYPSLLQPSSSASTSSFNTDSNLSPEIKILSLNPGYPTPLETIPQGTNMKVLVMGQTGSGKSTFLNMAANYLLYGSFGRSAEQQKLLKVIIPTKFLKVTEQGFSHSEYNVKHQGKSQTSEPTAYRLGLDDRYITFIDTPGMGDTEGLQRDEKNLEKILNKAAKSGELAGIILFFNGAETRDNTTKEYTFSKLIGAIPDVALKNMIVVLTNVRKDSCNFPLDKILSLGVSADRIFYMQNSVLASDPETWKDQDILNHLLLDWDDSMKTMGKIAQKLSVTSSNINNEFKKMYELRNLVKRKFHDVILTFSEMQETQSAIEAFQAKYESENNVAQDFKDYAQKATVTSRKFVQDNSRHYSTICSTHNTVCHDQCSLTETCQVGNKIFVGCAAFNGSHNGERCNTCSSSQKSCSYEKHYHARGQFMDVTETLQDRLTEYQNRYNQAQANAQDAQAELNSAQDALQHMHGTIDKFSQEVQTNLEELKKICRGYNFVAELEATIKVLKQEAKRYTSLEAKNSANSFISALEITVDRLSEQGFADGSNISKEGTGFGHQIDGQELNDMKSRSWLSSIKGNLNKLKVKKN